MTAKNGAEDIDRVFNRLSAVMQTRLIQIAADRVVKNNQQRMINQVDVNGVAFKARKSGSTKPMFARLVNNLRVLSIDNQSAVVGFTGNMGEVAKKHQEGAIETVTVSKNTAAFNKPAELRQAVELIRLGFKVGKTKPSTAYIQSNFSILQAAHLIKTLKIRQGESIITKQQWSIKNEIRTLLGVNDDDKKAILDEMITALNEALKQ